MLLNNSLNQILGQVSKIKILRFLINSQAQLNGREIAKNIGLSHVKAHAALKDLSRHAIVHVRSVGKSLIYWLNEDHFLVKEVLRPMFEKEANIFYSITKIIEKKAETPLPLSMILFGSLAKGGALPDSDIDILIIYPNKKNKFLISKELAEAEKEITSLFGNHLASVPVKVEDFINKFKKRDKFIREVVETGKVVYGKTIAELIEYESNKD